MFEEIIKLHRDVYYGALEETSYLNINAKSPQTNDISLENKATENLNGFTPEDDVTKPSKEESALNISPAKTNINDISDELEFYARRYGGGAI